MDGYFAYIRVSTVKQGERGSSLIEQRSAIEAYAQRHSLRIIGWFEERETAAKEGRREFSRMLAQLQRRKAKGLIIHKIDRSARNLRDWARLGDLIDMGVDIHFAHESLDLASRGGRLAADIQAVVAADYIRNLRQEVIKGFYGRLKQGFYPLPAPRGYLDRGKAQAKAIDPVLGPLVRQAYELYASGRYTYDTLREEMAKRGLVSKLGKPLARDAIHSILRNPFYIGLIRIDRTNEMFEGQHRPLVSKALFDRVQAVIDGRVFARPQKHAFAFRRMIRCAGCEHALTGETRRGHTYYRCHSKECRAVSLREPDIDAAIRQTLALLAFTEDEIKECQAIAEDLLNEQGRTVEDQQAALRRDLGASEDRLARLTDAFIDGALDKETFETRKAQLHEQRRSLRDTLENIEQAEPLATTVLKKFGQGNVACLQYETANAEEKREIVRELSSDIRAHGKNLEIRLQFPFQHVVEWRNSTDGGPSHALLRTIMSVIATESDFHLDQAA